MTTPSNGCANTNAMSSEDKFIGRQFGRLTVTKRVERYEGNQWFYRCQCSCGQVVERILGGNLIYKHTRSCGCLQREEAAERQFRHGMVGTAEHRAWRSMLRGVRHAPTIGGAGIQVCERWLEFSNFYADLGEKPGGTDWCLTRHDLDGDYDPQNCCWGNRKDYMRRVQQHRWSKRS